MISRTMITGLSLILGLGCTARAIGGGGGGGIGGDVDSGAVTGGDGGAGPVGDCATICARLQGAAGCTQDSLSGCMSGCQSLRSSPAQCQVAANAVLSCAAAAPPNCANPTLPFQGCDSSFMAYGACVVAGARDAGVTPGADVVGADPCASARDCAACTERSSCGWCAGRCWEGTSSGPRGGSCGGSPWAWTTSMCSAAPVDAGINNPLISGACQSCAFGACQSAVAACTSDKACVRCLTSGLTPSCQANSNVRAIVECACGSCASSCAAACEGL